MTLTGGCACGGVRFEADAVREGVSFCHCSQCRRSSGHLWGATVAMLDVFRIVSDETLTWYASSDFAKRGFCGTCGSNLFYKMNDADHIAIAAGSIDEPTGLKAAKHIFTGSKGDYYEITDDLPKFED